MSLNKLVGGDCGGNNSLVQLSNIVGRDAGLSQPRSMAEKYVSEFMAQNNVQGPQTFNMNCLLNNMPQVEPRPNVQCVRPGPSSSSLQMNQSWIPRPSPAFAHMQPMMATQVFIPTHVIPASHFPAQPFHHGPQIQYINESDIVHPSVPEKAQEYVEKTQEDDKLAYNQFMSFMKKMSAGELNLGAAQSADYDSEREQTINAISEKYRDEWMKLSDVTDYTDNPNTNGILEQYEFTEGNIMLENKDALELGKEKLKMGDIPGAVICFEAAAQQMPNSAIVWFLLGSTQAENEQDPLAIAALRKCVQLDASLQEAHLVLAAAYANENLPKLANISLLNWLKNSPQYKNLPGLDMEIKGTELSKLQVRIKEFFIQAVRQNPDRIDPDVQNALGVAFNISQEYDKAVDCFKTALMVQNDNPQLWNRLGATLANSNRSEEAVDAYHEALNLEPGFVRARYNVGITCMNLGAYKQAAEHFLVALNQQNKAESIGPDLQTATSPAIWMTLRMVCSYMGEHKVAELVDQKNLTELNKFFGVDA